MLPGIRWYLILTQNQMLSIESIFFKYRWHHLMAFIIHSPYNYIALNNIRHIKSQYILYINHFFSPSLHAPAALLTFNGDSSSKCGFLLHVHSPSPKSLFLYSDYETCQIAASSSRARFFSSSRAGVPFLVCGGMQIE